MIRPLSNSLNCEKCLLARLPGMFRLPKSSYNRRSNSSIEVQEKVSQKTHFTDPKCLELSSLPKASHCFRFGIRRLD
ncbi:hypothetical protein TNCV_1199581 [Trichonephila clavipes]|uniref:Uncharacterized protein n=1 Tax=Trichonephila clavipes TaxID=2585209 RepID=A0A8X6S406_TRICX|nr:hypothetical protein TNCV_1199581 [Trichonephila clavipes]